MPAPVVFFDIAGPDLKAPAAFYRSVFGWEIGEGGGFSVPVASPLMGTLRQEQPEFAEKVIYLGVPDITASLAQIVEAGGEVVFPRLEVKGVTVIGMFKDPAGNRMGLVEMDGDKPRVP